MQNRQRQSIALMPVALRLTMLGLALISGFTLLSRAGNLLQQIAVQAAGWLLGVFYRVHVDGLRILLCGKDILPDQPQSSTMAAFVLLVFFLLLAWIRRPKPKQAVLGFWMTMLLIDCVNVCRIFILAAGSAFPNLVGHVDVSLVLWHDLIGAFSLLIAGLIPLRIWTMSWQGPSHFFTRKTLDETAKVSCKGDLSSSWKTGQVKIWLACSLVAVALTVCSSPASPHWRPAIKSAPGKPFSMLFQGSGFHPLSFGIPEYMTAIRAFEKKEMGHFGQQGASSCRISFQQSVSTRQKQGGYHVSRSPRKARTRYC